MKFELRPLGLLLGLVQISFILLKAPFEGAFMGGKMKVYIVRHGDKEKGDFYDSTLRIHNHPLSQSGFEESRELWEYFKDSRYLWYHGIGISRRKRRMDDDSFQL